MLPIRQSKHKSKEEWLPCNLGSRKQENCIDVLINSTGALQDVLLYYGASEYGKGPVALGSRSPRQSFNPEADNFLRERGSYQTPMEHP